MMFAKKGLLFTFERSICEMDPFLLPFLQILRLDCFKWFDKLFYFCLTVVNRGGLGIGIYFLIHKCQGAIIHKDLFASITLRIKALVAFDGICQLIQTIQEDYINKT